MMDLIKKSEPKLLEALCDVFENMLFLEVEETAVADHDEYEPEQCLHAKQSIDFGEKGIVYLHIPKFILTTAVEMLIGDDEGTDLECMADDLIKELLNEVAGDFITKMVGEDCMFSLGLPEKLPADSSLRGENIWENFYVVNGSLIKVLIQTNI